MTYLIVPVLLETGLTAEALKQHRAVCAFHSGARRDVAEMMTTCFKFGNYMRVHQCRTVCVIFTDTVNVTVINVAATFTVTASSIISLCIAVCIHLLLLYIYLYL